jgi:hypothetical protein
MRRLTLSFCLVVAVAAAGCGAKSQSPPPLAGKPSANKPCPNSLPFAAGYLPAGFSTQMQPGPAPGKTSLKNVTIFHYSGPGGRYIEILRGGKRGVLNGSVGIIVVNHLGRIGPLPGGYAINFRFGGARCATYQIFSNENDKAVELVKVGHGMKATSGS